jgi:hypothetical protein
MKPTPLTIALVAGVSGVVGYFVGCKYGKSVKTGMSDYQLRQAEMNAVATPDFGSYASRQEAMNLAAM